MAKYTPGPAVASVSGSVGGTVFSRNRFGQYMRRRALPVQPNTQYQEEQRGFVGAASQAWQGLTEDIRRAWATFAQNNPMVDRLGQTQILTGHQAFVKTIIRQVRLGGSPTFLPPVAGPPPALATVSLTCDISEEEAPLVFTETPLEAGMKLVVEAAVVHSAGIAYVKNLYKQILISDAAQVSPLDLFAALTERFGTLQAGNRIFVKVSVGDSATGLVSSPFSTSCTAEA